jgi:DNA-binding response OmpR family regulator
MSERPRAVALNVDPDSLDSLCQAFPEWEIEAVAGANVGSLVPDPRWGPAELLIVGDGATMAETVGLCRGLRSQPGWARTAVLVLVPPARQALVTAVLEAGADSCLVLPVHAKELVSVMTRARAGNRPGRHTLDLDRAQRANVWQDEGGEA